MKQKKERSPWLWLLLIPAQLILLALSFLGGALLDLAIFSNSGQGQGHGAPIFTVILPLIVGVCTVAAVVVSLVGLTVGPVRRKKRRSAQAEQQEQQAPQQVQWQEQWQLPQQAQSGEGEEPPCS